MSEHFYSFGTNWWEPFVLAVLSTPQMQAAVYENISIFGPDEKIGEDEDVRTRTFIAKTGKARIAAWDKGTDCRTAWIHNRKRTIGSPQEGIERSEFYFVLYSI